MATKLDMIKQNCNKPKGELLKIQSELEEVNPYEAELLGDIITSLEAWQNNKVIRSHKTCNSGSNCMLTDHCCEKCSAFYPIMKPRKRAA